MELNEEKEKINFYSSKEQENDIVPLRAKDIKDKVTDKIQKNKKNQTKIFIISISVIFLLLFFIFIIVFTKPKSKLDKNNEYEKKNLQKGKSNNTKIIIEEKTNVAFIYPALTANGISRFMIVTGEYLLKTGKYNIYFFTKPKTKDEISYNQTIKRFDIYNNLALIKKVCKEEKIDFIIVNNLFAQKLIKWYKSLGVKVIGIYHGVFMSPMYYNLTTSYHSLKITETLDAFIQISADDYYFYKNLGFTRNIFIPKLYTFEPSQTPSSKLSANSILMIGSLSYNINGLTYAIKAMQLIVKAIPSAKLYLISSDLSKKKLNEQLKKFKLNKNVIHVPFTQNIQKFFLNSSVLIYPSATSAFPMIVNEAKAYGLPCVTFDITYSLPFQRGVIKVKHYDYKGLAKEVIKLLKNYDYRIKMGKEAKLSLNIFTNEGIVNLWGRLFSSLKGGEKEFQKFRKEIMDTYYDKEIAEINMKKQFGYLIKMNKLLKCHSFKNLTNLNYLNNIQVCKNVSRRL